MNHIHQIWIGDNPMPRSWLKTVEDFASDYKFKYTLWDDTSIKELPFDEFPGIEKVYKETERFSGKCNILRLLILYKYGGLYIDADCVLLHPDKLYKLLEDDKSKTFFAWEKLTDYHFKKFSKKTEGNQDMHGRRRIIANSVIGSSKKAPFIKKLLEDIPAYYEVYKGSGTWRETGPAYTANIYDKYPELHNDIYVYPMSVFYIKGWHKVKQGDHLNYMKSKGIFFQYGYSTNKFGKVNTRKLKSSSIK